MRVVSRATLAGRPDALLRCADFPQTQCVALNSEVRTQTGEPGLLLVVCATCILDEELAKYDRCKRQPKNPHIADRVIRRKQL